MPGTEVIKLLCLDGTDTIVIQKSKSSRYFLTTADSIIISKKGLITLINALAHRGYLHPGVFEGILEELNTE